jgi:hypothetical protein
LKKVFVESYGDEDPIEEECEKLSSRKPSPFTTFRMVKRMAFMSMYSIFVACGLEEFEVAEEIHTKWQ